MINSITGEGAAVGGESSALSSLDKDAFLKLLVAQLRYQNPMSPLDGQEYMGQAAQFAMVERLEQLNKTQHEAIAYQQVLLASDLIGKDVKGIPELAVEPVTGRVASVRFDQGTPTLILTDGTKLAVGAVQEVIAASPTSTPPTT